MPRCLFSIRQAIASNELQLCYFAPGSSLSIPRCFTAVSIRFDLERDDARDWYLGCEPRARRHRILAGAMYPIQNTHMPTPLHPFRIRLRISTGWKSQQHHLTPSTRRRPLGGALTLSRIWREAVTHRERERPAIVPNVDAASRCLSLPIVETLLNANECVSVELVEPYRNLATEPDTPVTR
jgi:hypothetical protein